MYTRSYAQENDMPLPDGYGGTMLGCEETAVESDERIEELGAPTPSLFARLMPRGLGGILPPSLLGSLKLGTEELLIGAIALFMLFSKSGDKECAIMLLLLLFIN